MPTVDIFVNVLPSFKGIIVKLLWYSVLIFASANHYHQSSERKSTSA